MKAVWASASPTVCPTVCIAMLGQGGRGRKGISSQVQQWVAQGHGASDISSFLKEQGYRKARVSQLLQQVHYLQVQAAAAKQVSLQAAHNILCQRCGFPNCSCAACTQSLGKGNAKEKHQCWLHQYGAHPKSVKQDPIHNQRVSQMWVEAREEAWAEISMDLDLHWDGISKSYYLAYSRQSKRQKVAQEAAGPEAAGAEEAGPAAEKVPTLYILLNVTHFLRMSHKQINK